MSSSSSLAVPLPAILVCVVATAVSNTIIRRIAMVPMEDYPLFLTICQTVVYVVAYGTILVSRIDYNGTEIGIEDKPQTTITTATATTTATTITTATATATATPGHRTRSRPVTPEMLRIRKLPFVWIGLCDSLGDLLGNAAIGKLPGYQPPLLAKLNIVFTAIFSSALLGETYRWKQIGSMVVVVSGSLLTLVPLVRDAVNDGTTSSSNSNHNDDDGDDSDAKQSSLTLLFYVLVYVASVAPTALGFVLKEQIFREHEKVFDLDIFVVNTYTAIGGLACQAVFFVPLAALSGVPYGSISGYLADGYRCFSHDLRAGDDELGDYKYDYDGDYDYAGCYGSPLAPVLYLGVNILYNICFLLSIKHGGTLLTFVTNTVTFPLSTLLFTCGISWPLLGSSARLDGWILGGLGVEVTGILWYYSEKTRKPGTDGGVAVGVAGGDHEQSPLVPRPR